MPYASDFGFSIAGQLPSTVQLPSIETRAWANGAVPKQCTFTEGGQQQNWTPFEEATDEESARLAKLVHQMGD